MKQLTKKARLLLAFACVLCLSLGMVFLGSVNTAKAAESKLIDGCDLIEVAPEVPEDKTKDVRQDSAPIGILHLEVAKTKCSTYHGIYNVDGKVAYYFSNAAESGAAEVRFSTEGTNTYLSSGSRIYAVDNRVTKITFNYKVKNTSTTVVADEQASRYLLQVFGPNKDEATKVQYPDKYNGRAWTPVEYTEENTGWQAMSIELTGDDRDIFSGFIFKMGGLTGELLIADVSVELDSELGTLEQVNKEPEGLLHIETGKVKKMTYHGLYNADGKIAYYFSNVAQKGAAETRFATKGTDTTPGSGSRIYDVDSRVKKFTFKYKLLNTSKNEALTDGDGLGGTITGNTMLQVYGPNTATGKDKYLGRMIDVVDYSTNTEWQTVTLELNDNDREIFSGFIFKMHGLTGELLIADINVELDSELGTLEQVSAEPEGLLHIETGKVKKMTYHGLYKADGKIAYYFSNDAENGAGETRFSTLNTDTTPGSGKRFYDVNHSVTKITFNYKVKNASTTAVADDKVSTYLLQVFGPNNVADSTAADKYNGRGWTAVDYTENTAWQTMSIKLTEDDRDIFSGFIFKMGGLTGELLIADIQVETDTVAPVVTAKENVKFKTGTEFDESKLEISVTDNVDETVSHTVTLENGAVDANGKLKFGKWNVTIVAIDFAGNKGTKVVTIDVNFIADCEEVQEEVDVLHIETKKTKNATYHGVYEVDGKKAYYFTNETALGKGKNMEARFSYGATDTSLSESSRVYESYKAKKISFEYKIVNGFSYNCDDIAADYIVQTFGVLTPGGKDCKYPIHTVNVETDGDWHTIAIDFNSEDLAIQFSGFIFKTGGLEGELLIANIIVEDSVAPVITVDENNKTVYTVGEELNILATANDEHDGAVEITKEIPDGMVVNGKLVEGKWTVVLTATDKYGNKATKSLEIEVKKASTPGESTGGSESGSGDSGSASEKPSSSDGDNTSDTEAGGCFGSVTGVASLAVVTLMAAAFVIVKKKKD